MKVLIILASLLLGTQAYAIQIQYPVKNFKYLSESDYRVEVQDSKEYVLVVFSNNDCLERTIIDRSCFMFEKKLDYSLPSFSKKVKVVAFNTYFENYLIANDFNITHTPTVILLKNNQVLKRFEPTNALPDINNGRLSSQDELFKEVLKTVYQIN